MMTLKLPNIPKLKKQFARERERKALEEARRLAQQEASDHIVRVTRFQGKIQQAIEATIYNQTGNFAILDIESVTEEVVSKIKWDGYNYYYSDDYLIISWSDSDDE